MARNFSMDQGATFARVLNLQNDAGVALDITGSTIRGQMRTAYSSPAIVATFTCTVVNATGGVISIMLTAAQTAAIPAGTYYYDVEWVTATDVVTRILQGRITVRPEITR